MTLDGFLTFLALAVGVLAIISPVARLRAKLVIAIQLPIAIFAFALVMYLEFFDVFGQPCPSDLDRVCSWLKFPVDKSFTPADAAFVAVFVWMLLALAINKFIQPGASSLKSMSLLVDELVYEKKFAEVLAFITPHLPLINRAANRKLPLQRWHDWIAAFNSKKIYTAIAWFERDKENEEIAKSLPRRFVIRCQHWFSYLASLVSAQRKSESAAKDIFRVLYRSAELRRFIVRMRPYSVIDLLGFDQHEKYEFSDSIFADLISDANSELYQEIKHNLTTTGEGYHFPEHNRLLHYLFIDTEVAEKLAVWKPIGDHILKILRDDAPGGYISYLNGRAENFDEERWHDPTFIGFIFFDLMVTSAAHQGVKYHMWLPYFSSFIESLTGLYNAKDPSIDTFAEFPTRSARLIYEAFNILGGWTDIVRNLPKDSFHAQIPPSPQQHNGNIPASAAISLGRCMRAVALSDQLGDTFAAYIHEMIMRDIKILIHGEAGNKLRAYLIQSIVTGGEHQPDIRYGERLATLVAMADPSLRYDVKDYTAALKAAYPGIKFEQ